MDTQSMCDKRRNKKFQKSFWEIYDSMIVDKVHWSHNEFYQQIFPNEYEGEVLVRVNPVRRN